MTDTQKTNFWKVVDFCQAFGHSVIDNMDKNALKMQFYIFIICYESKF